MSDHCVICGIETPASYPDDREYKRCLRCGVLRTRYKYNSRMYSESYATNYVHYAENNVNSSLQLFRLGLVSRWLHPGDKILDIGCCVGEFIRFAEEYYHCVGFEPNKRAITKKRCKAEIHPVLNGLIRPVNCATMFDVLEHIEEPKEFLLAIFNYYLRTGGILAITTPDVQAAGTDAQLRKWKHYKPEEHLFLYSERSLEILLEDIGFVVLHWGREESDIRPENPNGDIMTCVARKP